MARGSDESESTERGRPGEVVLNVRWLLALGVLFVIQTSALVFLLFHARGQEKFLRASKVRQNSERLLVDDPIGRPVGALVAREFEPDVQKESQGAPKGRIRARWGSGEVAPRRKWRKRRTPVQAQGDALNPEPPRNGTLTPSNASYIPGLVAASSLPKHKSKAMCYMGGIFTIKRGKYVTVPHRTKRQVREHLYGVDGRLLPKDFVPFSDLLCLSKCEKRIHFFGHMYSEYLDPIRLQQKEVNLLEIGLKHGDSVNLWMSAFPRGKIYGLDAFYSNPREQIVKRDERVQIFKGDQENTTLLQQVFNHISREVGHLDFIVDDGGHTMSQQIASFTYLFPLVRPGGVYFIEDLQTSYWAKTCNLYYNGERYCYGGGPPGMKNTTIDLIKSLVDVLNADFIEDHPNIFHIGSGEYKINPVDHLVGSVQCWRNMCAIRRKYSKSFF